MNQEFDHARNVYLDGDGEGIGRQLSHTHAPVVIEGATVRHVAAAYLHRFGELLGLTSDQLKVLELRHHRRPLKMPASSIDFSTRSSSSTPSRLLSTRPTLDFRYGARALPSM